MKIEKFRFLTCLAAICVAQVARAQISYDGTALSYSQNFDSLGTSTVTWSDNATILGWYLNSTVLGIPTSVAATTGGNSSGNAYNAGLAGVNPVTDRSLAWLNGSTTGTGYIGVQLQNNSGLDYIGDVTITLSLEQWSARNATAQSVLFDYKVLSSSGNQLTSSSWTQFASVAGPNTSNSGGAIDGNDSGNRITGITGTITFTEASPWIAGQYVWFRSRDTDNSGNDNMFGIDDVSVAIAPVPEPSTWSLATFGGLLSLCMLRRR